MLAVGNKVSSEREREFIEEKMIAEFPLGEFKNVDRIE